MNCVIIGNGRAPVGRKAINWTNTDRLSIAHVGENSNDIFIQYKKVLFQKLHLKCHLQNAGHFMQASMCLCMMKTTFLSSN